MPIPSNRISSSPIAGMASALAVLVLGWTVALGGPAPAAAQAPVDYRPQSTGDFDSFVLGPEGRLFVASSNHGTTRVWLDGDLRHIFPGHHAAITPDGNLIATGTAFFLAEEGDLRLFDAHTGELLKAWDSGPVRVLQVSDDGSLLLMGGHRGEVKVYSLPEGELLHDWKTPGREWMTSVSASSDHRIIAATSTSGGVVWEPATERRRTLRGHSNWVGQLLLGPSANWAVTASHDGTARVWDVGTGRSKAKLDHGAKINDLALSPDGTVAVTGGEDGRVVLWKVPSGEAIRAIELGIEQITDVEFSPDGQYVAAGMIRPAAALIDLHTGEIVRRLAARAFSSHLAFSRDGSRLAVGCCSGVSLYEPKSGSAGLRINPRRHPIQALAFSTDGQRLLASLYGHGTTVWELGAATPPMRVEGSRAQWLGASLLFLSGGECCGGAYTLWQAEGQSHVAELTHDQPISTVAAAADGSVIATAAEDGRVHLWDGRSGAMLSVLNGPRAQAKSLAVAPQGRFVAAGTTGGSLVLWRDLAPEPWKIVHHEETRSVTHLALSAESELLVSAPIDAKRISVWDLASGAKRRKLEGLSAQVGSFDFLPGGERLLVGLTGRAEAELWDLRRGRSQTLSGHRDGITSVDAGRNGRRLLTGSEDRSVRLWDLSRDEQSKRFDGLLDWATAVALDPAGRFVAAGDHDGRVVLWERETGRELVHLFALPNDGWAVTTPEGAWDASHDGKVRGLVAWQGDTSDLLANLADHRRPDLLHRTLAPFGPGKPPKPQPTTRAARPVRQSPPKPTEPRDRPAQPQSAGQPLAQRLTFERLDARSTPGYAQEVAVRGNWAYIAAGQGGLLLADLSDPRSLSLSRVAKEPAEHLFWDEDTLYTTQKNLHVFDASDPQQPRHLWLIDTASFAGGVEAREGFAYLADSLGGMAIYDLRNIGQPVALSAFDTRSSLGTANDVALAYPYVFVGEGGTNIPSGFEVIDVSRPEKPRLRRTYKTPHSVRDLTLAGAHLYLATGDGGLLIYDVSEPRKAVAVGAFETSALGAVRVADGKAFLAARTLLVLDVTDPTNPQLLGEYTPDARGVSYAEPLGDGLVLLSLGHKGVELVRFGE
ncbi:MAG: hypothetical protein AAF657_00580 [Acidobacteriota bacterium]